MKCPSCKEVDLLMSERQGIEIDYCPQCRGVWLDRGELDKFVQQSDRQSRDANTGAYDETEQPRSGRTAHQSINNREMPLQNQREPLRNESDDDYRDHPPSGKRKESFWGKMFDFD